MSSRRSTDSIQRTSMFVAVVLAFLATVSSPIVADSTDEQIRSILRQQGVLESFQGAMMAQIRDAKKSNSSIPRSTWDEVETIANPEVLFKKFAKLWRDTYTPQEIKEINRFVSTPTGRKYLANNGVLNNRMAAVAGLVGLDILHVLQRLHPDMYPPNPRAEAKLKAYLEASQNPGTKR